MGSGSSTTATQMANASGGQFTPMTPSNAAQVGQNAINSNNPMALWMLPMEGIAGMAFGAPQSQTPAPTPSYSQPQVTQQQPIATPTMPTQQPWYNTSTDTSSVPIAQQVPNLQAPQFTPDQQAQNSFSGTVNGVRYG